MQHRGCGKDTGDANPGSSVFCCASSNAEDDENGSLVGQDPPQPPVDAPWCNPEAFV